VRENEELRHALNRLMVKVLTASDLTSLFHVLLKLLTACFVEAKDHAYVDLVLRCMLKAIRRVAAVNKGEAAVIDASALLNVSILLTAVHSVFNVHSSGFYVSESNPEDLPLRIVRVTLVELYKHTGNAILKLQQAGFEGLPADSKVWVYLKEIVLHLKGTRLRADRIAKTATPIKPAQPQTPSQTAFDTPTAATAAAAAAVTLSLSVEPFVEPSAPLSTISPTTPLEEMEGKLDRIFRELHQERTTKAAMAELKALVLGSGSRLDVEPYLARCTPLFRVYIEKGLAAAAANANAPPTTTSTSQQQQPSPVVVARSSSSPGSYRQRLAMLRKKGDRLIGGEPSSAATTTSSSATTATTPSRSPTRSTNHTSSPITSLRAQSHLKSARESLSLLHTQETSSGAPSNTHTHSNSAAFAEKKNLDSQVLLQAYETTGDSITECGEENTLPSATLTNTHTQTLV
jgi:hypothetical protein